MLRRVIADLLFLRGLSLLEGGRARPGRWSIGWSLTLAERSAADLTAAAHAAIRAGDRGLAIAYGERALDQDAGFPHAREMLANLYLHGRSYEGVLEDIQRHLRPRTYIEIGVATGASIRLVQPDTVALGVDPEPAIQFALGPNVRIFTETSDRFFTARDVRGELGGLPLDLAFIDGMHHFEYALRDFANLERLCGRSATILVHDCFPLDRASAQRERKSIFWSGDVWRLIVLLKKYRPDLRISTLATPPTGLAVIRRLDPSSRVLADNLERLTDEFMRLEYGYLQSDRAAKLNLVPNEWATIRGLLEEPVADPANAGSRAQVP